MISPNPSSRGHTHPFDGTDVHQGQNEHVQRRRRNQRPSGRAGRQHRPRLEPKERRRRRRRAVVNVGPVIRPKGASSRGNAATISGTSPRVASAPPPARPVPSGRSPARRRGAAWLDGRPLEAHGLVAWKVRSGSTHAAKPTRPHTGPRTTAPTRPRRPAAVKWSAAPSQAAFLLTRVHDYMCS